MVSLKGKSTPIDQGFVDQLSGKTASQGGSGSLAANWFSPLAPLTPVAPKASPARSFDYSTGVNLVINPRNDECVTYGHMRFVAENCTLVTMAVETRKDQMAKQNWDIRFTPDAVEDLSSKERKSKTKNDTRIKEIRSFFKHPDKESNWDGWLRKLTHDLIVTDTASVVVDRFLAGNPYRARIIDGTTITRKIALDGTTPLPPQVAYQQIIKGVPYGDFTTDDLIFRPRNVRSNKLYGYSPVEQIIFHANMIMRRDMSKLNYYTEGNMPPALVSVGKDWTADQIFEFQQKFDAAQQGDLAANRRIQFIPEINQLHLLKEATLKDEADEWFARIVMYAFSLPPTALTKQMNRATAEQSAESAEDEGLLPLMNWVKDLINDLIYKLWGYDDIEFVWTQEKLVDPKVQADIIKIYVDEGIMSRNQAADRLGIDPIDGGDTRTVETSNGPLLLSEVLLSTKDKISQGLMMDPTVPKTAPAAPVNEKTAGEPTVSPEKADAKKVLRQEIAKRWMEVYEDLNPELRDPVIIAKLAELELGKS